MFIYVCVCDQESESVCVLKTPFEGVKSVKLFDVLLFSLILSDKILFMSFSRVNRKTHIRNPIGVFRIQI